jgi:hypothetical protein
MDFDFIKIFVLFLLLTPGFLFKKMDYLLCSLLFTLGIYLVIPTLKIFKEGYEDYKIKVNGVSHLVKVLEQLFNEVQKNKAVTINNDLTSSKQ